MKQINLIVDPTVSITRQKGTVPSDTKIQCFTSLEEYLFSRDKRTEKYLKSYSVRVVLGTVIILVRVGFVLFFRDSV